ncbi:MAG: hypothetical protein ACE5JX_15895 [Acidobacteriota bacterium]
MPLYTLHTRQFPNNQTLIADSTFPLSSGASIGETAPPNFDLPDPANPSGPPAHYVFLFWSLGSSIQSVPTYNRTVPDTPFSHTRWYVRTGGGNGSGVPHLTTYALSLGQDSVLSDTPIDSVTPSAAWAGGQTVDTASSAVTVDAKNSIGGESFHGWTLFGPGSASGDDLNIPKDAFTQAIAAYRVGEKVVGGREIPEIRALLDGVLMKLIDLVSDPSPIDLVRLKEKLLAVEQSLAQVKDDGVTELLGNLDTMSRAELRVAAMDLKARTTRVGEAAKAVEKALKRHN